MTLLKHVDLCSGIGGFSLGFQWAQLSNPILFCDIEPWCRKILTQHWPDVPIYEDVKEIANDPERFIPRRPDILTAGYPCQPFSVAGRRKGEKDDRHIWPEIFSIIQSRRPTWTVFENVRGHITMGLDSVLADLEREGYSTRTFIVPAIGVDAPHKRDRVWIVSRCTEGMGYSTSDRWNSVGSDPNSRSTFGKSKEGWVQESSRGGSSISRTEFAMADSERNGLFATSESRGSEETIRQESEGQRHALNSSGASGVSETEFAMANTEGNISDGIRREADQESDRGNSRMESECSRDRQSVSRPTSTMADSRRIDQGSEEKSEWTSGDSSGRSLGSDSRSESEDGLSRTRSNLANTESQQSSSSNNRGEPREVSQSEQIQSGGSGGWSDVADTDGSRSSSRVSGSVSGQEGNSGEFDHESDQCTRGARQGLWPTEPNVGRVADGIPNRVDRIKGLGNAIVPQIAYRIGLCIKEAETD